ncbi:MAG: DNA gyrase inhibitor YacG [Gemmobacter sp.]|nr:DNA gyrase inhibitor YacG [Gemmobacter sp.]
MSACPICRRPADPAYRPFCSRRCADVDLARWFNGSYAIPATEPEDDPDAAGTERRDPGEPEPRH